MHSQRVSRNLNNCNKFVFISTHILQTSDVNLTKSRCFARIIQNIGFNIFVIILIKM